ncbi:MAG: hypothetical protein APF81_24970 [Desulfosporosinus sp. BRH_c37]|nr:MAG: hypothetical protein APF81_24970 [Desulfosporosinus sp. BRH_c37]
MLALPEKPNGINYKGEEPVKNTSFILLTGDFGFTQRSNQGYPGGYDDYQRTSNLGKKMICSSKLFYLLLDPVRTASSTSLIQCIRN